MSSLLQDVDAAADAPATGAQSDRQLLGAFIRTKDEAAFETLVRRHGPMVFGVCRRLLGNEHDAADAFQAVFLVLARKAASIRSPDVLGGWLYNVAYRTSMKARAAVHKRRARERQVTVMPEPAVECEVVDDVLEVLDEELRTLPAKYQTPVVLCDLQGQSRKAAAALLKVPEGTLSSRLAAARKMLAERLRRRGVVVATAAMATFLIQHAAAASVPAPLLAATVKAAFSSAVGQAAGGLASANALALSDGVIKSMLLAKLKLAVLAIIAPLLAGGALLTFIPELDDEGQALATLTKLGAKIRWEMTAAGKHVVAIDLKRTRATDQHVRLLHHFKELREVVLSETGISDAAGADLARLPKLQTLRLTATQLSDDGLRPLAALEQLTVLGIGRTGITDACLKDLAPLVNLRDLDASQTSLTSTALKDLAPFTKLQTLSLSKSKVSDQELISLSGLPELATLRLDDTAVTDAGLKDIARVAGLETLALDGAGVTDAGLRELAPLQRLFSLSLNGTKVTDAGLGELAALKKLQWLGVVGAPVTGDAFADPAAFAQLQGLWLTGTKITLAGVKHVAGLSTLQSLYLDYTALNDAGIKELTALSQLSTVSCEQTQVTDACIADLAGLQKLWHLNLSKTKVTDRGLETLAGLVKSGVTINSGKGPAVRAPAVPRLGELLLHKTQITDAGVKHLTALPKLNMLSVSWTKVSDAGLKDIARLKSLQTLRLGGNQVTDAGLKDLAGLTNLHTLWIDWTQITDAGLKELLALKRLVELRLDGTAISDDGLKTLAGLKQLRRIDAKSRKAAAAATKDLQAALPNVTINATTADDAEPAPQEQGRVLRWLLGGLGVLIVGSLLVWRLVQRKSVMVPAVVCASLAAVALIGYRVVPALFPESPPSSEPTAKVRTLRGHTGPVHDAVFTPDGRKLISTSGWPGHDSSVRIWDLETDQELHRIAAPGQVSTVELTADARFALVGAQGAVFYIEVETGEVIKTLKGHRGPCGSVAFSADGQHVYSASLDGVVRRWHLTEAREVQQFRVPGKWARFVTELSDGRLLTGDNAGVLQFWDISKGVEVGRIDAKAGWMSAATLAPGGKQVLVGSWGVHIWDLASGTKVRDIPAHQNEITRMVFSPDGKQLLTSSFDGTAKLWDYESGTLIEEITSQKEMMFTATFSADGKWIATGGGGVKQGNNFLPGTDHDIRLWPTAAANAAPAALPAARDWLWPAAIGGLLVASGVAVLGMLVVRRRRRRVKQPSSTNGDNLADDGAAATVSFSCSHCGKSMRAKARLCGKKGKCPGCGTVVLIPPSASVTPHSA